MRVRVTIAAAVTTGAIISAPRIAVAQSLVDDHSSVFVVSPASRAVSRVRFTP